MNKRTIVASLRSIANTLDQSGLYKEANEITDVMVRLSQQLGYANMSELEQKNRIDRWVADAINLSTQTNEQFNRDGSGTQNAGWNYIRGLKNKGLYPEVYDQLVKQFAEQVAVNQKSNQKQKQQKFPQQSYMGPDSSLDQFVEQALEAHANDGNGWEKLNELIRTNPILNQNEKNKNWVKTKFYYAVQNPNRLPSKK
jgi:hypothetical protein